ncbi:MAG: hypothetical protein KAU31_10070, partial [Spirochaetaceae bacterium]|nr:hypothetical protein [Spirochaetaceae bacterium]
YDIEFNRLRGMLIRKIRELKPDLVMTWYPNPSYIEYQDHIRVGQAAVEAAAYAELPLIEPEQRDEGLEPWYVKELCLFGQWFGAHLTGVNAIVNITETLDRKIEALWKYDTQMILLGETVKREAVACGIAPSEVPFASLEDYRELVAKWVRSGAASVGRKIDVPYAEQFVYRSTGPVREVMSDQLPRSYLVGP